MSCENSGRQLSDSDDPDAAPTAEPSEPATKPLSLKGSFGTAVGGAMLGFEQALRDLPPAEVIAAEHAPERGGSGDEGHVVIRFPDPRDDTDEPGP